MATKPSIRVHDVESNEIIDREMNDVEYAEYLASNDSIDFMLAAKESAAQLIASRNAKLIGLGLTPEELSL